MADKYGITKNCVTEATVKSATFDEKTSKWEVKYIRDGEIKTMTSNVYVGAVGQVSLVVSAPCGHAMIWAHSTTPPPFLAPFFCSSATLRSRRSRGRTSSRARFVL